MANCNPKSVPSDIPSYSHLGKTMCSSFTTEIDSMPKISYRETVDSSFVNQVARLFLKPCLIHWESVTMLKRL
jgi:hypothetical protein